MLKYLMLKNLLIGVLLLITGQALAIGDKDQGVFLGVAGGTSSLEDDDEFSDLGLVLDDSDSSFKLFGGYQFLRYLAVEVAYTDFGTFKFNGNAFGVAGEEEITTFSVAAVGILPIADCRLRIAA